MPMEGKCSKECNTYKRNYHSVIIIVLYSRNTRATWVWNNTAPVAGNYYPVNSRIFMRVCTTVIMLNSLLTCS